MVDADKACGVADFAALLKANGAKRVLLAAPVADAELAVFAEKLSAYLTAAGSKVKSVTFTAESNEWFHYFDTPAEEADFHLYLCENTAGGVLSLVSKNADATALFADRKSARTKVLCGALDAMSGSEYLCTVMHGKSLAFLD